MGWLPFLAALLLVLGAWLLARSAIRRQDAGLPAGRLTYIDTAASDRCERPLYSGRYRLTGRPDYLVRVRGDLIPVEVKSSSAPSQPYLAHVLQLAAYCLLVEEQEGRAPPYGIVKYSDRAFEVDYDRALRARVLEVLDHIRRDLRARDVARSHQEPGRCAGCGFRDRCDQQLAR